jgi:hypothetical protein
VWVSIVVAIDHAIEAANNKIEAALGYIIQA